MHGATIKNMNKYLYNGKREIKVNISNNKKLLKKTMRLSVN